MIHGPNVYFLGATGNLLCIELISGKVIWERAFRDDFPIAKELPWGYCGSPLLLDDKLIVAPGAPDASIVALEPTSGKILWKCPGKLPSYGSLNVASMNGQKVIVGHDQTTLGAWLPDSGRRLWSIAPLADGDFNVPTPLQIDDTLVISTRNNGTRQFRIQPNIQAEPVAIAENKRLRPDMTTPVVVGNHLYCVREFLYCLDLSDGLKELWRIRDPALSDYASLIASGDRLLVVGDGELLLLPTDGSKEPLGRLRIFSERQQIYSHPALVGNRLYIRGKSKLMCVQF